MADGGSLPVLASDAERERACDLLRDASAEGRLTLDEFTQRVERALAARTRSELEAVTADLPPAPVHRLPIRSSIAILGSIDRVGYWRIGDVTSAISVLGSCKLDLRGAAISAPVVTVEATTVLGSLEVIVPEGVEVDLEGVTVMGSKVLRLSSPPRAGAPVVRVTGLTLMGSVTVRDRPSLGDRLRGAIEDWLDP